ncbi:MAG: SPFH domain-containing protein [Anaerovoracaceae bacterium]|jgi:regulator of protease activity HflC (stomatin/prohibitin superfamily)
MNKIIEEKQLHYEELNAKSLNGMFMLILNIVLMIGALSAFIYGLHLSENNSGAWLAYILLGGFYSFLIGPFLFVGLKILQPNEALVLTLFGKYYGTLKGEGFYFVNPFATGFNPSASITTSTSSPTEQISSIGKKHQGNNIKKINKKISLKSMTLNNEKQKINDELGNPIIIGIVVIWRVVNTAKAVFNVDDYTEYLSIQCDSSLRNIVRLYPYDASSEEGEKSLRGSSQEVAEKLRAEIQSRVEIAGLEIMEARITHLAYAPEIAAAMLQRQQASAIIAAKQMIVEGAVDMVEMALTKLNENDIVDLDEERKAAMVSNLLVVLCGNKDVQPIVNNGSLY